MFKDMKASTSLESLIDEDNIDTSLELTPETIAHERQLQLERESNHDQQQDQANRDNKDKHCHATVQLDDGDEQKVEVQQEKQNDYTTTTTTTTTTTSCPRKQRIVNATNSNDGIELLGYEDSDFSLELTPENIANERLKQIQRESNVLLGQHRPKFLANIKAKSMRGETDPPPETVASSSVPNNFGKNTKSRNMIRGTADSSVQVNNMPGAFAIRGMDAHEEEEMRDSCLIPDEEAVIEGEDQLDITSLTRGTRYARTGAIRVGGTDGDDSRSDVASDAQLPTANPVDIDALKAQYNAPSRGSVLQRMKSELTVADEIVENNNTARSNSKFRIVVSTVVVLLVFIFTATVIDIVVKSTKEQQGIDKRMFAPTASPKLSNFINLQEQMKSISGDTVFDDSSPQYEALSWLAYEDPFILDIQTERDFNDELIDRYVLAVVYFSTGGPNWLNDLDFLTNSSVCDWNNHHNSNNETGNIFAKNILSNGVYCDNGGVTKILLGRNNLNGIIPFEIGTTLTSVDEISISNNYLNGTIPSSFGNLFRLEFLDVSSNVLYGTIPTSFSNLTKLEYFSTRHNRLTGSIPSGITNLVSLERLDLSVNKLTGSIPEFSIHNSLEYLSIFKNLLDGPLPESLVQLSNLEVLNLSNNTLTGTLPSKLGMLENLSILLLFENYIGGSLPTSIGNLDLLITLALEYNSLTGSIPSEIGKLTKLYQVNLDHNNLSGTIPTELNQCTSMYGLHLDNNPELNGTIPLTFADLNQLERIRLHGTSLTGSFDTLVCPMVGLASADCGGLSPKVNCSCCFECCDPISGICTTDTEKQCDLLEYSAAEFSNHTAECTCADSGRNSTCISLKDCPTCNEDNTICGTLKKSGWKQPSSHFSISYHNTFQYNVGRNETIVWDERPEFDCNVSINGQPCNECSVYYCRDGFPARHIDCTNIVDVADGGVYETCQHYEKGGIFEYISWFETSSWTGCLPFFYRPLQ